MTDNNPLYPKLILDALSTVRYPGSGKNLAEAGMIEDDLRIDGRKVADGNATGLAAGIYIVVADGNSTKVAVY